MSAQTRSTYRVNTAREKTSDAKLQYVHFVRQKGTEIYRPSGILPDYPTSSALALQRIGRAAPSELVLP
jgi:hypothetical protein